jgi:hybrid polyketide synthase/nonribosomal peptide synthetase ACE1
LHGPFRIDDFSKVVKAVAARHESLRTCFFIDATNQGMQGVLKTSPLYLEHKTIEKTADILTEYQKVRDHHYDLSRGETMKIIILTLSQTMHQMIIGYHHINMDGISLEVLVSDLQLCYNNEPLPPVTQYPDFSVQQHKAHSER